MKAYHFLKDNMNGGYGKEKAWKIGEERTVKGSLKMCKWGYHASPSWYDALSYAQGNMACVVDLSGGIVKDTDKYVARTRKLIDAKNVEKVLRDWACDCAERALKRAKVNDERSWNAIKVARLYNKGEATNQQLAAAWDATRAARDAARDATRAAWAAAWDAALAATRDARDVAWDAALAATRDATRDAARGAARAARAARDAEIRWQKRHLNKLMNILFEGGSK